MSTLEKRRRRGSLAMLAGSAMLAWAAETTRKSRPRAALLALIGATLFGIGRRQRRADRGGDGVETAEAAGRTGGGEKTVSDEAHAEITGDLGAGRDADESRGGDRSETELNPRGTADGADLQADDGGEFDFVEGKEPGRRRETHLEDEDAHDPRLHPDSDDEPTEVDLSTAAMADEASEAAGPHPEQAYPAREGTDPEPMSDEAPPRVGEGTGSSATTDDEGDDDSREGSDESEEST